ncbi:beta-lactamase superfamily domain-containing protein [Scheffersomyces coipomensis]|uniref:beta-lactamase superfamily domain-containing protein n=1 Tax=Scheffersomyces coipomensis TaxID=1788519 RepID=UPI00315C8DF0
MFTVTTATHITADTSHPLISLTTRDGDRYLFGKVPEGTQRALVENKFKLTKLKSLLLTGTISSWAEIGGLPGLFLTLSDATKKGIDVYATSSILLSYIVSTWRSFVFRKGSVLRIFEADSNKLIADNNLVIKPIKIRATVPSQINEESVKYQSQFQKLVSLMFPLDTSKVNDRDPESYKSDPAETDVHARVKLPHLNLKGQESLSYLVRFLPVRGKFDPHKAKALGLKPGENYRKLSSGISVYNDDGILVTPEQVVDAPKQVSKLLVLDIPNKSFLENTITSDQWFAKNEDIGEEEIGIVYHFLGGDIDLDQYTSFLNKFNPETKHVICHPQVADNTLVFKRSAINTLKLRSIQPDHYNLPHIQEGFNSISTGVNNTYRLHSLQKFIITADDVTEDSTDVPNFVWSSLYDEHISPFNIAADKDSVLNSEPNSLEAQNSSLKDQIQITTLGTGSAIPSLDRNVISTLIRVPYYKGNEIRHRSIVLDGGENTLGTMLRNYGHNNAAQFQQIFEELDLIHLSHLHADHHLGLISVINKWFEINGNNDKTLYLITPWQYNNFIKEWYDFEGQLNSYVDINRISYISCEEFLSDRQRTYEQIGMDEFEELYDNKDLNRPARRATLTPPAENSRSQLFNELGISDISTTRAIHCAWAYSISITFKLDDNSKFKVSYSGDTRANPKFVEIGYGSDLLIHECTLDNELIEEAIAKKHSTMIEAINVARFMNCPKVILTHFSTRYSNKANLIIDRSQFVEMSNNLNQYLEEYHAVPNIFSMEKSPVPKQSLDTLEICYAFDFMSIRYGEIHLQKAVQQSLYEIFNDEGEVNESKIEKHKTKTKEKREIKRLERMAFIDQSKKKRRVSTDEEVTSN